MFYVGDIIWLENGEHWEDIPDFKNFSGYVRWVNDTILYFRCGTIQDVLDSETKEWMSFNAWYAKGVLTKRKPNNKKV